MSFWHGGEIVARVLKAQGVNTLYTLCGGHIAPIYDGCLNNSISLIDFRHEQAAAHAADAHARLTRNIGAALVTAGPGVTDAVTGVANAYQARSPMILLGGAAPLKTRGMGALQEMPQTDMFGAFTKASFTVERTEDIAPQLRRAFEIALHGRPGPVFVELPFDVLFNAVDAPDIGEAIRPEPVEPALDDLQAMFAILRDARRPVVIAGTQVYWEEAHTALRALADQTGIPVFTNGAGRGTLPMDHPQCFKSARSAATREADAIVLIGTPLDFRLKYGREDWNPAARLIQVENDRAELNHNRQADVAICANARLVLEALAEGLQGVRYDDWLKALRAKEDQKDAQLQQWMEIDSAPINHFRFAAQVSAAVDEETLVIGDGGDIVSACAKVITLTRPAQWLDPGPLGCLGVGAPFAIAAKHLFPEKKVLIISGDGSFGLNGFEFDTAVRFNLPIVSIVGNDAGWGQIRTPQKNMMGPDRAVATSLAPTRYDRVVEALGGYGEYVERAEEILSALQRAFSSGKPACLNVPIDPDGMVRTGASTPYIV
ncbi:MAG: thiamine pyrophosphate-dependent enzyme [Anaerolineae bacterium]|nr:thiamine pyrophosphate-dependent enzyme [Anaerolineae bacterium]NUQ02456.1 acetolactate synthase [Anaerolineae bacterium]